MDRLEIVHKRLDMKGLRQFFVKLQDAYDQGYRFNPEKDHIKDAPRLLGGIAKIVLFKGSDEEIVKEEFDKDIEKVDDVESKDDEVSEDQDPKSHKEILEGLSKKEDLLNFAKHIEIEIPEDITHVKAIKKYLEEQV